MSFTKDPREERYLDEMGVEYRYLDHVLYTELIPDWHTSNIGRELAVDEKVVDEYLRLFVEQNSIAPAVFIHKTSEGYEVLDGVQRLVAAQYAGKTHFAAYEILTKSQAKLHAIRCFASVRLCGNPPGREFALRRAVERMIFEHHWSQKEVAQALGRNVTEVKKEVDFLTNQQLMNMTGYDGRTLSNKSRILAICGHVRADDYQKAPAILKQFLELVDKCGFNAGIVENMAEVFVAPRPKNSKNVHKDLEKGLRAVKEMPVVQGRIAGKKVPSVERIHTQLKGVLKLVEKTMENGARITDEEYCRGIAITLAAIRDGLKKVTERGAQYPDNRARSLYDAD